MTRDIRALLARARDSFDTICLEWTAEYDTELLHRSFKRSIPDFDKLVESGAMAILEARSTGTKGSDEDRRFRHDWRVWWRKPSSWRDDVVWEGGATGVSIVRGTTSTMYVSLERTLYTNEVQSGLRARLQSLLGARHFSLATLEERLQQVVLVDPSFLISGWELTVLEDRKQAGRHAVHVRATWSGKGTRPTVWESIDEYDVLIDRERGVLLRYTGIVDGQAGGIFAVRSVRFDEPIPDDVFIYEPPEGTRIVGP